LRRIEGSDSTGRVIIEGVPVCTGRDARVAEAGDHRLFAGWRSDPFFFDVLGALNDLKFTGNDYFTDKDVCSIVLELPDAALGSGKVGLWMRALVEVDDRWVQVERGGRPQIAVFLSGDSRDAYQAAEPAGDARFVPVFAHSLEHTGGYSSADATRVAAQLLPDILRYDPTRPASYPNNGRALTDDVVEFFLPILSNGKIKTDNVRAHRDLLDKFPYLGPPHANRTDRTGNS
jgi:hypothetical protein